MKSKKQRKPSAIAKPTSTPFFNKSGAGDFFAPNTTQNTSFFSIQPKLSIGKADDSYEKEADSMADQVVNAPINKSAVPIVPQNPTATDHDEHLHRQEDEEELQQKPLAESITPLVQRAAPAEDEALQTKTHLPRDEQEEEVQTKQNLQRQEHEEVEEAPPLQPQAVDEDLQTKSSRSNPSQAPNGFEARLRARSGTGTPLSSDVQQEMETGFGANFSGVRIHTDQQAAQLSADINAQAFTHGNDIYFNQGKYDTSSRTGKHLLAHELTHTIQQGKSKVQPKSTEHTLQSEPAPIKQEAKQQTNQQAPNSQTQKATEQAIAPGPAPEPTPKETTTAKAVPQAKKSVIAPKKIPADQQQAKPKTEQKGPVGEFLDQASANVCANAAKKTTKLANNEKTYDPASQKLQQTEQAVVPPSEEGQSKSNTEQVQQLDQQEAPKPDEAATKASLNTALEQSVPRYIEDIDTFKTKGKAKLIGNKVLQSVNKDVTTVKATYSAIEKAPAPQAAPTPTELPAIETAPTTPALNLGKEAVPAIKSEHTDLSQYENQSDDLLKKEEISQEQLDLVDSGDLAEANKGRTQLKTDVAEQPAQLQTFAQEQTQQVEKDLQSEEQKDKAAMKGQRKKSLNSTKGQQQKAKTELELKREAVTQKINGIYEAAKTSVTTKLNTLEKQNLTQFDTGQQAASTAFEDEVNFNINRWKRQRYSGILAGVKWAKDKLFGIDDFPEIQGFFATAKTNYINKINQLITQITKDNNTVIEGCKTELATAKLQMKKYVDGLAPALQTVGNKSLKEMKSKLEALDGFINKKKAALEQKLCDKKEEAIQKIDKKIEKMKEAMSGLLAQLGNLLLNALMKFFKWVLEKAGKSPDDIMKIISQGKAVLKKIFTDPIGFIMNIVTAVKNGISGFQANIKQYLVGGLVNWLTGAMGDVQITLPQQWNLKGIISFVLQILGIGWDIIRQKLVKQLGEKLVARAERTVDVVKRFITEGPMAIWEMIKEKAQEIKTSVMEGIRSWAIVELIKQGITKLVSFLNPAGALVQAILAIYNTVMFFVENWQRIVTFVQTVFNSIRDIAMGKLAAAAKAVEKALGMTIPIIMAFLARLIGLGGIGKAVMKIVKRIRRPIDKAVGKAVRFIVSKVQKLFGKGKKGRKGESEKKGKNTKITTADKKKHQKIIKNIREELAKDKGKELRNFTDFYEKKKKLASQLKKKNQPKVKSGIKLTINFVNDPSKDAEDNDIDLKVKIAPNTSKWEGPVSYYGDTEPAPKVRKEANREFKAKTSTANGKLKSDLGKYSLLYLSTGELNAASNSQKPFLAVMFYGSLLERMVADELRGNNKYQKTGGPNKEDFRGKGAYKGLLFDVTTAKAVKPHLRRKYGARLIIATYRRPANFFIFPAP